MTPKTADLINQVVWLLNQMDRRQILRVLSYANRLFCQEPQKDELQQSSQAARKRGRENHHPQNERP